MTPQERKARARSRTLIPLLVALLGVALGTGGIALLRPLSAAVPSRLAATAAAREQPQALSATDIRARVEPSVVDVTATLTYDDETASGTGFVVDARSVLILTNNHVIRDATSVTVTVPSTGQSYPARIVGVNVPADIAVLQISPAAGLAGAPLGHSPPAGTGTHVISFGNQAGAGGSPAVALGVISGTGRTIQADDGASGFSETLHNMLATTARIEPGDSGGPLVGSAGTVIGMDTAAGTTGSSTGYAIPIDTAMAAARQIAAGHRGPGVTLGTGGFLGVILGQDPARFPAGQRAWERGGATSAADAGAGAASSCVPAREDAVTPVAVAPAGAGALVAGVLCGTSAATTGIAAGDVITAVDGHRIVSAGTLSAIVSGCRPGSAVAVTWVNTAGTKRTALVRLGPAPAP